MISERELDEIERHSYLLSGDVVEGAGRTLRILVAEIRRQHKALTAIQELHTDDESDRCPNCLGGGGTSLPYPCPTMYLVNTVQRMMP